MDLETRNDDKEIAPMIALPAQARIARARQSFATRRVPQDAFKGLDTAASMLRAGDVVLATVTKIGQHAHLELPTGRRSELKVGQDVIIACGARYAPDQFHALLPERLGKAHLVAGGGIAGIMVARHSKMKEATSIEIVGRLLDDAGQPINLADYALPMIAPAADLPIIAVAGTSMNAGKTASCGGLVRGLAATGWHPAYVKATGTGSGGDMWALVDAGAEVALDFTDAGYGTTYLAEPSLLPKRALSLAAHAAARGCDVVVMEIADGVLQEETAFILKDSSFKSHITCTVLAAADSMGACAASAWLEAAGHDLLAVTGAFTQSPLAISEVERMTGLTPTTLGAITDGALSGALTDKVMRKQRAAIAA
jgi:hypothetical protein